MQIKGSRYKRQIALLFGAVAMLSYISLKNFPKEETTTSVVADVNHTSVKTYLLDDSDTLVPISFRVDATTTTKDRIFLLMDYMNGTVRVDNFSPLFQQDCELLDVTIEGGIATLSFNEAFSNYDEKKELRVLEALAWGVSQFQEVENVKIQYQNQVLTKMPVGGTPIPEVLNQKIGINHFETSTTSLYNSSTITVFYTKNIGSHDFFVPKSKRIPEQNPTIENVAKYIMEDISASSQLSQPLYNDNIDIKDVPKMENGTLIVHVNANILDADRSAKQQAYDALILSLSTIMGVDHIKVYVDDVVVSLHGSNEEAISVSSMTYNEIPF